MADSRKPGTRMEKRGPLEITKEGEELKLCNAGDNVLLLQFDNNRLFMLHPDQEAFLRIDEVRENLLSVAELNGPYMYLGPIELFEGDMDYGMKEGG